MKASQIRDRARSLSDLQNSEAITWSDEVRSLNESYKDIYNKLCQSDFDYNVKELIISNWTQYADPNNVHTYNIPLPSDFYQLRFVDYNSNGNWYAMNKMNVNQRDYNSTEPLYRLKNSTIWMVIGEGNNTPAQIKISYYPVPDFISLPDQILSYNMTAEPYKVATTTSNWYIPPSTDAFLNTFKPDIMLYNYDGKLVAESIFNASSTTILAANVTQLEYHKGYLYWAVGGQVYRSPYDPGTSTSVSGTIISGGWPISNIQTFNISNNVLYSSEGSTTIQSNVDGTSPSYYTGSPIYALYVYDIGDYQIYINGAGALMMRGNGIAEPGIVVLTNGGFTNLAQNFIQDTYGQCYELFFDISNPLVPVATKKWVTDDVAYLGGVADDRLSLIRLDAIGNQAITSAYDYDLSYPSNTLYEIMSYQMAIDFKRKYDAPTDELKQRIVAMWETFLQSMIKQDQYKVERIQNTRQILSNMNWIK